VRLIIGTVLIIIINFLHTCIYELSYIYRILIKKLYIVCENVSNKFEQNVLYFIKTPEINFEKNKSL